MWLINIAGILCLIVAGRLYFVGRRALKDNNLVLRKRTKQPKIAVLIPARDESKVIRGILKGLLNQTVQVRSQDIYVIVERMDDPTCKICEKMGVSLILRKNLKKQRKGYALNEAVKEILLRRHYDIYFVFDADNLVAPNYIEKMLESYSAGYDMATGYRNSKNVNANVIAAVSSLTFSMINVMSNRERIKHNANVVFSGTGCFVSGDLVEKWRGWPFHSLTEDYEMSLYATLYGLATFYNEEAEFFDEQPTTYRQTVAQRVRWIKGYFESRKIYIPKMKRRKRARNQGSLIREELGVSAAIWVVVGVILLLVGEVLNLLFVEKIGLDLGLILGLIGAVYVVLMLVTIVMIRRERFNLKTSMKIKAVLFNPLYLVTYIPCAVKALTTKNVAWQKIEHGGAGK